MLTLDELCVGEDFRELIVLIVEDDDFVVTAVEFSTRRANKDLVGCGIVLVRAATVEEGRELVSSLQPDICLVDLGLPDGDGLDVAKLAATTHARVAILSGAPLSEHRADAREAGAIAYLEKLRIEELKKQPDFLKAPLTDFLIRVAHEQAENAKQRWRIDLEGRCYQIGEVEFTYNSLRVSFPNGRTKPLTASEREVCNFFCTYPRETMTLEDFKARLAGKMTAAARRFEQVVGGLNEKFAGHALIERVAGKGYRMKSGVSLL